MSSSPDGGAGPGRGLRCACTAALLALAASSPLAQGTPRSDASIYAGIGRPATPQEIAAWDTDVRPDFKGLPKGSGSVAQGQTVWEGQCASCHGVFGESNQFFQPLVGGTTAADVSRGRVARLTDPAYPGRTTLMKLSSLATLWDYIRRAMPWHAPKSLSNDEVYAVTAFLLHLGGVVPDTFVLDEISIREVQQRLPNRLGTTTDHGLWPGRGIGHAGRPDVRARACMSRCATEPTVASLLPEHARDAHGNLAEQNRGVGPQRGADTRRAAGSEAAPEASAVQGQALARRHNCLACHGVERKVIGPALRDIAKEHAGRADAIDYLARKITEGGSGAWGPLAMPAQTLPPADARALASWLAAGAP